jgi:hypothetical protein
MPLPLPLPLALAVALLALPSLPFKFDVHPGVDGDGVGSELAPRSFFTCRPLPSSSASVPRLPLPLLSASMSLSP